MRLATTRLARHMMLLSLATLLFPLLTACGGDEKAKKKEYQLKHRAIPGMRAERLKGGYIRRSIYRDLTKTPYIVKTFQEVPDLDDPSRTVEKLRRMDMDLNDDGKFDVVRHYSLRGTLSREETDTDFDGKIDLVLRFKDGVLTKKEIVEPGNPKKVLIHRFYANGKLLRIEKDRDGNGKVDYWEFYNDGVIDRIGIDYDGKKGADAWQRR